MSALQELVGLAKGLPNTSVENWKKQHKKVVGFFCSYVPEEILYALDLFPYRVRPVGCTETASADAYLSQRNCTFTRSCLEFALNGKYDFLDGLIFMNSCDHVPRLRDLWEYKVGHPSMYFLEVPHKINDLALNRYKEEIDILKASLEKSFAVKMNEENLYTAIEVYNQTRGLLRELYELRKRELPPITGSEAQSVVLAAQSTNKKEFNELLKKALAEVSNRECASRYEARVMICGSGLDDIDFVSQIEALGALVVADTLCFGSRYFWNPVEVQQDLLDSLAKAYLGRPHCPRMVEERAARENYVLQMVRDFKVDAIIYQTMRYCDGWGMEGLSLKRRLEDLHIPILSLEREYAFGGRAQMETRVQALLEMLKS